jgi:hypothetical protein
MFQIKFHFLEKNMFMLKKSNGLIFLKLDLRKF